MRKGMQQTISIMSILIVGLVVIALLIVFMGNYLGIGSDIADDTVDTSLEGLDCQRSCSRCCALGNGDACETQYDACDCQC